MMSDLLDLEIIRGFVEEALESLAAAEQCVLQLEGRQGDTELINAIFRPVHSIKGNSGCLGLDDIQRFSHQLENLLDELRKGRRAVTPPLVQVLLEGLDILARLMHRAGGAAGDDQLENAQAAFAHRLAAALTADPAPPDPAPPASAPAAEPSPSRPADAGTGQIRIDAARLDDIVAIAGDLFSLSDRIHHLGQELRQASIDRRLLVEYRDIGRGFADSVETFYNRLREIQRVSVRQVTRTLTRVVHDVSLKLGKEVALELEGEHLAIDRELVAALGDPLVHLVRNALDHGLESPAIRRAAGKPACGRLCVTIAEADEHVLVTISDDGAGIDEAAVRRKAVEKGLLRETEAALLTPAEVHQLIFHPGLSTAAQVSDVSGRGVGMDVVLDTIRRAGGQVQVRSQRGLGTTITLTLPKHGVPVQEGLLARIGPTVCMIPLRSIRRLYGADAALRSDLPGGLALIHRADSSLPLIRMNQLSTPPVQPMLVEIETDDGRAGCLAVDDVLGMSKSLIKPLTASNLLPSVYAGCFIMGDGGLGFLLDIGTLLDEQLGAA